LGDQKGDGVNFHVVEGLKLGLLPIRNIASLSLKAWNLGSFQYGTLRFTSFHTQVEFCLVC